MEFQTVASGSVREEEELAGKRRTFLSTGKPVSVFKNQLFNLIRSHSLYERPKH